MAAGEKLESVKQLATCPKSADPDQLFLMASKAEKDDAKQQANAAYEYQDGSWACRIDTGHRNSEPHVDPGHVHGAIQEDDLIYLPDYYSFK